MNGGRVMGPARRGGAGELRSVEWPGGVRVEGTRPIVGRTGWGRSDRVRAGETAGVGAEKRLPERMGAATIHSPEGGGGIEVP